MTIQSARLKKWTSVMAVVAFMVFAVINLVRDLVGSDPVGYYRSRPSRLLFVAGIAAAAGLLIFAYYKFPPRIQKRVRICGLALLGTSAAAAGCYLGYAFYSLALTVSHIGGDPWMMLQVMPVVLLLFSVSAYCWFKCWRVWRGHGYEHAQ